MDFGLAKTAQPSGLTGDTTTSGTFGYMAPEQLAGKKIDTRCDIWAYGAVLHEMLTGRLPGGQTESLPEGLGRIMRKALAGDAGERYQHVEDMLVDLRKWQAPPAPRSRRWLIAAAAAVPVAAAILFRDKFTGRSYSSLAVLPLENLSGDAQQEWFSDGMTETLIAELSKIKALKVISRTSVMTYKKTKKPLREIARELGVDAVIEGSAMKVGERVRITAQLIDAASDRHLWANDYDGDIKDALSLHREVARTIAREVRASLTPSEQVLLAPARSVDPRVLEAVLRGDYQFGNLPDGLEKAREYFEEAIRMDPGYAPAHAGLGNTLGAMGTWGLLPQAEAQTKAHAEAQEALRLDETLPEAHLANMFWHFSYMHDWPAAEKDALRALELAPSNARAHSYYAQWMSVMGRHEEAIREALRARELDPNNRRTVLFVYYLARRFDEAIAEGRKAANTGFSSFFLGAALYAKGSTSEAMDIFLGRMETGGGETDRTQAAALRQRVAREGPDAYWRNEVATMPGSSLSLAAKSGNMACAYAQLRMPDEAMRELETCYRERGATMWLLHDPLFDPIRQDPRFRALMKRVGYPEAAWK
jgi:TolB-like protein